MQASAAESVTWSASSVVIHCVICVVLLTITVSACAIAAAVKLGRRDLDRHGSVALCCADDSDPVARQSTARTSELLSTTSEQPPASDQGTGKEVLNILEGR